MNIWGELSSYWDYNNFKIAACLVFTIWFLYKWLKRPPNFPPGPNGLPLVGKAHKMFDRPEIQLMNMAKKYGPVMGVKFLNSYTLILSDTESVHEAFVKQGPTFAGRQKGGIFDIFSGGKGIAGIDGAKWKENRKFASYIFRQLGAGKKIMENKIVEEMIHMCYALQTCQDKAFDPSNLVTHTAANLICGIAFGERFDYTDLKFITTARTLVDWFSENANAFLVLTMIPSLKKFPYFSGLTKSLQESVDTLYSMLVPIIDEHQEKLDGYEFRDFVEAYLIEIEKNRHDRDSVYTYEELKGVVRDFFVAGTDTTATTVRWTLIFLLNRPETQKKIQKEIDKIIGPDAFPKMAHLDDMHYTKAFMHEMLRHRTPGPLGLIHRTVDDTKFMGYDIPKDTQVIANIWAIHRDPAFWDEPEKFRPERFLNADKKFQKQPNYLPFSIGTRYCMGESLVKMEFFFFLVVVLQRFHLEKESPDSPPISEECVKSGQFLIAPRFKMRVKERFCRMKSILEYRNLMWE